MHAAVHPGEGDEDRDQQRRSSRSRYVRPCSSPRVEQERDAAVDGDRRGGVARRIARVHRQRLETVNSRAVPVDHQRRRAVGAGLDGEREEQERGQTPVLGEHGDRARRTPAMIGNTTPPAMIEPTSDASVSPVERCAPGSRRASSSSARDPVHVQENPRDEQTQRAIDRQAIETKERSTPTRYVQTGWPSPGRVASSRPRRPGSRSRTGKSSGPSRSRLATPRGAVDLRRDEWLSRHSADAPFLFCLIGNTRPCPPCLFLADLIVALVAGSLAFLGARWYSGSEAVPDQPAREVARAAGAAVRAARRPPARRADSTARSRRGCC